MTGEKRRPDLTELADVPVLYIDGSIRFESGETVKLLLYTRRASDPDVCDHVATLVMTRGVAAVNFAEAVEAQIRASGGGVN